jgi:hypothetical protein
MQSKYFFVLFAGTFVLSESNIIYYISEEETPNVCLNIEMTENNS